MRNEELSKMLVNEECTCIDDNYPPGGCPTCQILDDPPEIEIVVCGEECYPND